MRWSIIPKAWAPEILLSLIMLPSAAFGQTVGSAPPPEPALPPVGLGTVSFFDAAGGPGTLFQVISTAYAAA